MLEKTNRRNEVWLSRALYSVRPSFSFCYSMQNRQLYARSLCGKICRYSHLVQATISAWGWLFHLAEKINSCRNIYFQNLDCFIHLGHCVGQPEHDPCVSGSSHISVTEEEPCHNAQVLEAGPQADHGQAQLKGGGVGKEAEEDGIAEQR